ncbi:MAG: glutamine-hydrolyzing GMP synthase [Patescibacteria group bacterium]|nr:glutamine-hydrolyzing GMP synthase [Patescibacteria group bacterium]
MPKSAVDFPQLVIVDLGSQYSHVIVRTLREMGYRSALLSPSKAEKLLSQYRPKGIIWSGGAACVSDPGAPVPPKNYLGEIPVLGICLGMQYLATWLGGKLSKEINRKEYGPREAKIIARTSPLFKNIPDGPVLCSHGDSVQKVPPKFHITAVTDDCPILAMEAADGRPIYGVQFHPEVTVTTHGKLLLENFVKVICGCKKDWQPANLIASIREEILETLPKNAKVLHGFSGGVDSTVIAALLSPVLGNRLIGLTIDGCQFRAGELDHIEAAAKSAGLKNHRTVKVCEELITALGLTTDAEAKRRTFKSVYSHTIERVGEETGATYFLQGTLATDLIEAGQLGGASLIKSHHNVGLPLNLTQLHPLRQLFKHEVRDLARALKLPPSVSERMPFPGPGLLVRIFGVPVTQERLELLRRADAIAERILKDNGALAGLSQLVVALCGAPTVGVKGDEREYGHPVVVRAVKTVDFMTAETIELPPTVRRALTEALTQIPKITRVFFDETPKPPATIEME